MAKKAVVSQESLQPASLKSLARHLGLSPSTISVVLNDTPGRSIPEATRERVRQAAIKFNYRPSLIGRTLQGKSMKTIGILLPVLGEAYHAQIVSGVGNLLIDRGFFYFTAHHGYKPELIREYPTLLHARGVDGILALDTHLEQPLPLPAVLIAGQTDLPKITNVVLDHAHAAQLALSHLHALGHRRIVFMKGQRFSADTQDRWTATMAVAKQLGLSVDPDLIVELEADSTSPEIAYPGIRRLIERSQSDRVGRSLKFTAVLCFNDLSAIGTIRALHDAGLRVPEDVSVLGFDDVEAAPFHVPSLTTIRQPLQQIGAIAADALLRKIAGEEMPGIIRIEPELIVRESTSRVVPQAKSRQGVRSAGA
jgi:LacI family transcriptional regulator